MRRKNFIAGIVLLLTFAVAISSFTAVTLSSRADSAEISLYACPDKTVYIVGQTVEPDGAKLLVGGQTVDVTADMLIDYSTESTGVKTVGIRYGGETVAHFDIEVVENFVVSLEIKKEPDKLSFGPEDSFSAAGGELTAVWYDETQTTVNMTDSGVVLSGYTATVSGRQLITVKYSGGVTSYFINVQAAPKSATTEGDGSGGKKGCKSAAATTATLAGAILLLGAAAGLAVRRAKNVKD